MILAHLVTPIVTLDSQNARAWCEFAALRTGIPQTCPSSLYNLRSARQCVRVCARRQNNVLESALSSRQLAPRLLSVGGDVSDAALVGSVFVGQGSFTALSCLT